MRNFDEYLSDDLSFQVRGEVFQMAYVRPEVMAAYEDEIAEERAALRAQANGDPDAEVTDPMAATKTIERLDRRIKSFLRPEDHDRWDALRAREQDAIPYMQLKEIERWMVEVQSARPTQPPSASASGPGGTARSSTVRPRSREATPAT